MHGIKENQEQKLKKYERFKRFRVKSCRSINLPVKNMASGAPRGHITTGIFSTDKVVSGKYLFFLFIYFHLIDRCLKDLGWKYAAFDEETKPKVFFGLKRKLLLIRANRDEDFDSDSD